MVIFTRSSAAAGAVSVANAIAAAASPDTCFMVRRSPGSCYSSVSPDILKAAKAADHGIGADRQHEQHDQHGVHSRHIKGAVGVDDEKTDAFVRQFGLGQKRADQSDAETESYAIDDRMPHGGKVDLQNHL